MEIISARELSQYLRINEKKVYKLVQESKIPHIKIGGKIAFVREIVDRWILENTERENHIYIAGSDDILLKRIIDLNNKAMPNKVFYAPIGSINGLKMLNENAATISCVHILDMEKKSYTLSYIKRYLTNGEYIVIQLFMREQGLYIKRDNPKSISGLGDLSRPDILFVNRNQGSGTRLLFDFLLKENQIDPLNIKGYNNESVSHLHTGLSVLRGEADAGFGIMYIAHLLGLEFIPLFKERFDMVIPREYFYQRHVKEFISSFEQPAITTRIRDFTGYNMENAGGILYQGE